MQARGLLAIDLAKAHDNAELVRVDAEGEGVKSNDGCQDHCAEKQERAWHAGAAGHDLLQPVLTALEQLFQVRLLMWPSRRALSPGTATASLASSSPTLITPRH